MHMCKTSQFLSLQRNKVIFHYFIARNFPVSLAENWICSFIDVLLICSCCMLPSWFHFCCLIGKAMQLRNKLGNLGWKVLFEIADVWKFGVAMDLLYKASKDYQFLLHGKCYLTSVYKPLSKRFIYLKKSLTAQNKKYFSWSRTVMSTWCFQ